MSISWYVYRAEKGAGAFNTWDTDRSERIGVIESVKDRLSNLYPCLRWTTQTSQVGGTPHTFHSALGTSSNCGDEYLDLHLKVDSEGYVRMIRARMATPTVVIAIMEALALDSVYQDQPGVMIDPYAVDQNWQAKS